MADSVVNIEDVPERVRKLITDELGCEYEFSDDAKIGDDLGADSLDAVSLIMRVEEEFGIEIPDDTWELTSTVAQITEFVKKEMMK